MSGLELLSLGLWLLGYPDQARRQSHEVLLRAQEIAHPMSFMSAVAIVALLAHLGSEELAAHEHVEAALALATEHGFAYWEAYFTILRGAALAAQGQRAQGMALLCQGSAAYRATGVGVFQPYWLAWRAEASRKAGQSAEGLRVLAEALEAVHRTGERWWEAELHRLTGELLWLAPGHASEAKACFQQALDVARRQEAKSLELRAAMSLSRLWQQQGKHAEARELLAPIYGWFTEGFDTADLQEAKALLDTLA
jgi:predicted ATPase